MIPCEATYLLWLDCSKITKDADKLQAYIRKTTGLYLSSGSIYGKEGNTFLRMNIATTKARVIDGLKRLKKAIDSYKEN